MCYCTNFVDDCINYQNLPLAILYSFCRERINNLVQNNVPVIDLTKSVSFCDGQHATGRSMFVRYQTIARASLWLSSFNYYLYLFCSLPFLLSILYHTIQYTFNQSGYFQKENFPNSAEISRKIEKFQNFVKYLGLSHEQGYIDIYIYECMDLYVWLYFQIVLQYGFIE